MNENIKNYKTNPKDELDLLNYIKQFNNYSIRNISLIQGQYQGGYGVASYKQHQNNGYQVQKGEKSIRILAPRTQDVFKDENNVQKFVSNANKKEKEQIKSGNINVQKNKIVGYISVPVFDITQTDCPPEDYPKLYPNKPENFNFEGSENQFKNFRQAIENYATDKNINVSYKSTQNAAKGYYVPDRNNIVIDNKLNDKEQTKVLLHEISHAKMHNKNQMIHKDVTQKQTNVKEYQAEMTAYLVSSTFQLDSEDYSQKYLANWTEKKVDNQVYIDSLKEVKDVSNKLIENISNRYVSIEQNQENTKSIKPENTLLPDKNIGISSKLNFLSKNGQFNYEKEKDNILKCTNIHTEKKKNYNINTVELSNDNESYYEKIYTSNTNKKRLKKWKNGLTGQEWLNENLLSETSDKLSKNKIDSMTYVTADDTQKLEPIQNKIQEKEINRTPSM